MMDPHEMDEDKRFWNSELFRAIEYRKKRPQITEEKIITKVKESLCEGSDIDAICDGNSVLHVAIKHHYEKVIKFLLENGAKVDIKNSQGLTALTLAQKLNCKQEIINLLESYSVVFITKKLSISCWSKNLNVWNKLRNNSEIVVLEVNSYELNPDFLQQVEFYDAIDTAGNLFFVDVMVSDMDTIDEEFIKIQLQRMNNQLIFQCGSNLETKVYFKNSNSDVNVVNLNSPIQILGEDILTEMLSSKVGFGIGLIIQAIKLELVGTFENERRSLLNVSFFLEKHFGGWKLIDHAIRYGDVLTVRFLSLSDWNLLDLKDLRASTLSIAAEYGNMEKLAAVLKVKFPIQFDNNICLPKETAAIFDKCKKEMLSIAVRTGNGDVVSFLLRCGAESDKEILDLAWERKRYDVVLILLKADWSFPSEFSLAEIDHSGIELRTFVKDREHLHRLIEEGHLDSVKKFLKSIPPSKLYLNKDNRSAIRKALMHDKLSIFVWLKCDLGSEFRDENERCSVGVGVLDSAADAMVPLFVPIENAHILQLVARSRSRRHYSDFKENIENIYTELNSIPQISTLLKVMQFCDQVDIIYDFDKDSIVDVNVASSESDKGLCEYKAGRIYIGAKVERPQLLGTIAHELTHLAIQTVYDNDCKPYKLDDLAMKDQFDEIVKEMNLTRAVDGIIRRAFYCYPEVCWPSELIVRVNHMLATYGSTEGLARLEVQAKSLLEFYTNHVEKRFENLVAESHLIKPRYLIKVLNDISGIMCRIDESKIRLKECINVSEALCGSEAQFAVVTSTSHLLSTMSVYHNLKETGQQSNSFIISNFDGYVKRRSDINQALYSDVCKILILMCESIPDKRSLSESLKKLAQVLWKKSDKKVIFIMENCELLEKKVNKLHNLSLVIYNDVKYTLDHVSVESAQLLLDQSVSLQCRDANIKLSSLINEEHFKLVDAQTLLKLINKQSIVIGKDISNSSHYDQQSYVKRSFNHQAVIKEDILLDGDRFTLYAISEIDETALVKLVEIKDLVCTYKCLDSSPVKYVIIDEVQQYQQLCQRFPLHNIHWLKKVDDGLLWLDSRCVEGDWAATNLYSSMKSVFHFTEDDLVNQIDEHSVIVVSDTAGMGKSSVLTSLTQHFKVKFPLLWVITVDLNDYTKACEEQSNHSTEIGELSTALEFLVVRLLGSRVESKLETEFEKNLLLHFLQHNEDRVVIMFDGFDEIKERHQNVIKDVLVALQSSKVKQLWVTTRPHMRETLENTLHHLSYTLQPFDEAEQVSFLTTFWRHRFEVDTAPGVASDCTSGIVPYRLHCFAEALIKLLSKSISDRENVFTGVPLQLMLLAECFVEDAKEFYYSKQTQPILPPRVQLNNLYQMFFIRKYLIFQTGKNKSDFSKPNVEAQNDVLREHFLYNHQISSLFTLFDDKERELLLTREEINSGVSFISEIASRKWNTGIIDVIVDGKPRFVHMTFAEYLTAEFIVSLLAKGQQNFERMELLGTKVLYADDFKIVRAFIDSHLSEKTISDAILNEHGNVLRSLWGAQFHGSNEDNVFPGDEDTWLHVAAEEGNSNIANFVLKCQGSFDIRSKLINAVELNGKQALHIAAENGHLDVVKVLHEHEGDVNARVEMGNIYGGFNALSLAAYRGHADVCEWLIDNGADPNATVTCANVTDKDDRTPLHLAASKNKAKVVEILVSKGANVNAVDCNGNTPLHWAIHKGFHLVVELLTTIDKIAVKVADRKGHTPLHLAVHRNDFKVVKILVGNGADVNFCDHYGQTPLHLAAVLGHEMLVEFLLQSEHIDVSVEDKNGRTALHLAVSKSKLKVVEILVNSGANVNAVDCDGRTPLHLAVGDNSQSVVEFLLKTKDVNVNATDKNDTTPLHQAAVCNEVNAANMIVNSGANVNAVDLHGWTPLHWAAAKGSELVVELLLRMSNIDVNIASKSGHTPLHLAARHGKLKIVEMLVASGANCSAVDSDSRLTPLDMASEFDQKQVVDFLKSVMQHH